MATEAQKRATRKYDAGHTVQLHLKLNKGTDADILEWLKNVPSVQGYIKELIRRDMDGYTAKPSKAKGNGFEITFPAVDGYRDEEAIKESLEKGHTISVRIVNNWEVRVDADARKVLTVKDMSRLNVPGCRRIL